MTKRTVDWIHIIQPDGKNMIASPRFIAKLMGIPKHLTDFHKIMREQQNEINQLKEQMELVYRPFQKANILALLKGQETGHNFVWLQNRLNIRYLELFHALTELLNEGQLLSYKSGRMRMYKRPSA